MNPFSYTHFIFDKGVKNMMVSLFNKCWEKWLSICRKLKLDSCLSPCTSINSKRIKDLNIRHEILQLVQERAGSTQKVIGISNDFFSRTQEAQQLRERMSKWNYIKLKSFCTTTEMVFKLKRKSLLAIHQTRE
jgi:hypothetical protein